MKSTHDISTPDVNELVARSRALVETNGLEFVIVAGADTNGVLRGKRIAADRFVADPTAAVPLSDLALVLDVRGEVVVRPKHFEGWWPSGETTGHADVLLVPDLSTLRPLPWTDRTGIVLADFRHVDGSPVSASPSAVLRRVLDRAGGLGLSPRMAAELEFYLLGDAGGPSRPVEGYCAVSTGDADPLLSTLNSQLRALGLQTLVCCKEGGPGQYEITIQHNRLPAAADEGALLKYAIKNVARIHGAQATFMSQPIDNLFGSGCHIHQSLLSEDTGRNLFFEPDGPGGLSEVAYAYIAGQLATHADFTCIWASTTNSYKRLQPYVGASVSWAFSNRAAAVRVAAPDAEHCRVENRAPGGEANVYLAMAASLAGGLYGIESGLEAPEPSAGDFYEDPDIEMVPMTLSAAIDRFEASEVAREYLGEEFVRFFAGTRRWEVKQERSHVTDWEVERYSDVL
jgi:glutamine synthetase